MLSPLTRAPAGRPEGLGRYLCRGSTGRRGDGRRGTDEVRETDGRAEIALERHMRLFRIRGLILPCFVVPTNHCFIVVLLIIIR